MIRMTPFGFLLMRTLLLQERRGHGDSKPSQCDKGQAQSAAFPEGSAGLEGSRSQGLPARGGGDGAFTHGPAGAQRRCSFAREGVQEAVGVSRKEDDKMGLAGCLSLAVKGPRESGREVGISSCR